MARSSFIDSNGSIEGGDFWRPDYSLSPLFHTPPKAAAHAHCMFKGLQNNLHQVIKRLEGLFLSLEMRLIP